MSAAPNPISDALDDLTATAAPAIEPDRVMVLSEHEQTAILQSTPEPLVGVLLAYNALANRITYGDEYADAIDELARRTLRKRRLEEEVRRENKRITEVETIVVEQMAALGVKRLTHDATGATLRRTDKAWLKYTSPELSTAERAEIKAQAAQIMVRLGGDVGALVKPDYNSTTASAYYRERYNALVAEQHDLPEHERRPVNPDDLIPAELRALITLDIQPHIEVRRGS